MAAEVSSMVKSGGGGGGGGGNPSEILITRDLLGQFSKVRNNRDLDLKDFHHLQMSLDLKTEMICSQRCNSPNSPLSSSSSLDNKSYKNRKTQEKDSLPLKFLEESRLELKLVPSNDHCQSVCTLDKVRFALKRAEKETIIKKRHHSPSLPSQEEEEHKEKEEEEENYDSGGGEKVKNKCSSSSGMFAAACPGCLMYVMTLKTNPKCPRCNSIVPSPLLSLKKPRIDLNASL